MTEINPPGFLQNAGSTHTAEVMREAFNALIGGRGSVSFPQRARGGVHPATGSLFFVAQNGTPNMSVNIGTGHAFVPGSEGATQGLYSVQNDGTVNKTITAADPSLPRIDIVVLKVQDSFYSGATNAWSLAVVTGTPASSPAVPTAPANSLTLAQIAVAAGATSIVTANITDVRPWLAAVGGLVVVRTQTERDALLSPYDGYPVYRQDTNQIEVYNGSSWDTFTRTTDNYPTRIAKGADESRTSNTTLTDDAALFSGTLPANSIWYWESLIKFQAPGSGSVGGIKIAFSGPTGATAVWAPNIKIDTDGTNQATSIWMADCDLTAVIGAGGGGNLIATPRGEIMIGATPGQLKFRWAQNTSNATPTIVKNGSRLYLRRVG